MERAVQIYATINLTVIGLSHVVRPRVWVNFFVFLRERGEAGVFAVAILNLIFGSIIVAFHNVWSGIPAVLTVVGWANVVKALVYFTFPAVGLRRFRFLSHERASLVVGGGFLFLVLAGVLGYHLWQPVEKGTVPLKQREFRGENAHSQGTVPFFNRLLGHNMKG